MSDPTKSATPRPGQQNGPSPTPARQRPARRGVVLIVVLSVIVVLSLAAYTFTELMQSHHEGAIYAGRAVQARLLVDSAVDATRIMLFQGRQSAQDMGGFYDNPEQFRAVMVAPDSDPRLLGAYTILAPQLDAEGYLAGGIRYGLEDLSARINLNFLVVADTVSPGAGRDLLMQVPGMDEMIADAILDFIDPDDEPRELGAESEYYSGMGLVAKNGPLDTIEELLEVRDMSPELLFGGDWNRNGTLDLHEADAAAGGAMPGMERGWAPYLTLHSAEANLNAQGLPRVYLNQDDLQVLSDELSAVVPEDWVTFILAYRQNGPYNGDEEGETGASGSLDLTVEGRSKIGKVLDLVGAKVEVTFSGDSSPTVLKSPFENALGPMIFYLPTLMDNVTVNPSPAIPGRININQASRAVLMGIPGMDEETVDRILEIRVPEPDGSQPTLQHETWLLTEGVLQTEEELAPDLERMKTLTPFICAGGDVYSAQIIGFFQEGGVSSRAEVVFDATSPTMTILMWRDMSHLGRGFALEDLGILNY